MLYTPSSESAWVVIYRPPRCPAGKFSEAVNVIHEWITKVEESLERVPNIYITGDFNLASMKTWDTDDIENSSSITSPSIGEEKEQILKLVSLIQDWSLTQEVKESTHSGNVLDLLFTNNSDTIEEVEIIENFKVSDHALIIAKLARDSIKEIEAKKLNFCTTSIPQYNLKGASVECWRKAREDFTEIVFEDDSDPETLTVKLIESLESVVAANFDVFAPPSRANKKSNNFIPREARCLLKRKLNAGRSLQKTTNPVTKDALKKKIEDIEDSLRKLVHKKKQHDENKARENLKYSPESFLNLVRKITKKPEKIGPLKRNKINKNWPTCEVLSAQYSSVFSTPREIDIFDNPENFFLDQSANSEAAEEAAFPIDQGQDPPPPKLSSFEMSQALISQAIDKLPARSAPGPDGVPNFLLKQLKFQIIPVLENFFENSLKTCHIPSHFLNAYVKPLKKVKKT